MDDLSIDGDIEEILLSEDMCSDNQLTETANYKNWKTGIKTLFAKTFTIQEKYVISVRWIFTVKYIDGKRKITAIMVARGFEEWHLDQNDSPTNSRECLRLMLTLLFGYRSIDEKHFCRVKLSTEMFSLILQKNLKKITYGN